MLLKVLKKKERSLEDSLGDEVEKEHKMVREALSPEQKKLRSEIDGLHKMVKTIALDEVYMPNKLNHLRKWTEKTVIDREFSCDIDPNDVERIMLMEVKNTWKILLLMGIGVFTNNHDNNYTEIMKQLEEDEELEEDICTAYIMYSRVILFLLNQNLSDVVDVVDQCSPVPKAESTYWFGVIESMYRYPVAF